MLWMASCPVAISLDPLCMRGIERELDLYETSVSIERQLDVPNETSIHEEEESRRALHGERVVGASRLTLSSSRIAARLPSHSLPVSSLGSVLVHRRITNAEKRNARISTPASRRLQSRVGASRLEQRAGNTRGHPGEPGATASVTACIGTATPRALTTVPHELLGRADRADAYS